MSLAGSVWTHKKTGIPYEVVADAEAGSGRGNRGIRMRNCHTGREHWATPEGLGRKYRHDYTPPRAEVQ